MIMRSRAWLSIGFVVAALLVTVTMIIGRRAVERTTVERTQVERRALADQGARQLEVSFEAVRRRLADPALRAFSGAESARSPEAIASALRVLAGDHSPDQVIFFVHDLEGRLVAVDPAVEPEMRRKMLAHRHRTEDSPHDGGTGVCPMCATHQHAVSIARPLASPLRKDLFLAANVRLDRVGATVLSGLTFDSKSSVCLKSRKGLPIVCRGAVRGESLGTSTPVGRYPVAVKAVTERSAVVGEVRRHSLGFLAASGAALAVLLGGAGLALWSQRRRARQEAAAARRLAELDKLATLGTMAAGVMHEIASPLTAVKINLEVLDGQRPDEVSELRGEALEGIRRIQRIADLRRFSRRAETVVERFDLREPVSAALRLAAPRTKYVCRVDDHVSEPLWVRGNAQHVTQVVLNLVSNAADALRTPSSPEARIVVSARRADGHVELSVEDNGPGVKQEHVPKLFSLFFTTKPADSGTGLGLALSARLAADDGGSLRYEAASPGARFVLELPLAEPASGRA